MTPPAPVTVPNPVIIRKALLPSADEVAKFKQSQIKPQPVPLPMPVQATPPAPQKTGALPTMNMARPLDPVQDRR